MNKYEVKDMALAPSGHRKIEWVKANMPLLSALEKEFEVTKPFEGIKISLSTGGSRRRDGQKARPPPRCLWEFLNTMYRRGDCGLY